LFAVIGGNVQDLKVSCFDSRGAGSIGSLAGRISASGSVQNVQVEPCAGGVNHVRGIDSETGGLAGSCVGLVSNVSVHTDILQGIVAGNVCGSNEGLIENAVSSGTNIAQRDAAGIVGYNFPGGIVRYCASHVQVGNLSTIGSGGLVGTNFSEPVIEESDADGAVAGGTPGPSGGGAFTGGLVAANWGSISNSYSVGGVDHSCLAFDLCWTGGLSASNQPGSSITNSYTVSPIDSNAFFVGALVAGNLGSVQDSYYDPDRTGVTTSAAGTSISTSDLQSGNPLTNWSSNIWLFQAGSDPSLLNSP